jgi:putative spermidine/putrescine transport system ATP-binding protein
MSEPAYLALEKLTLGYGEVVAVAGLDLSIGRGELVALLGPSGCGKTTTMRAIAGLLRPVSGRVRLDGADITRLAANKRQVGLMFQSYALFPHLTVFENVAFGLRLKGFRGSDLARRVESGLQSVGLTDFAARKTTQLSGGQQQRVALARSMVMEPKVLLLDEPLSNLDARLRLEMRAELQRVQKETGVTMIFVTHDQGEALALADRIGVMWKGAVEQIGTPEEIYDRPVSAFVADFVGFENRFAVERGGLKTAAGVVPLAAPIPEGAAGLAWRPEAVAFGAGPFQGSVRAASFAGATRQYLLDAPPLGPIKAEVPAGSPPHGIGTMLKFDLPVGKAASLARF